MAQAAFAVNQLKIEDKGDCLVLEAVRCCQNGHVLDRVYITMPASLRESLVLAVHELCAGPATKRISDFMGDN